MDGQRSDYANGRFPQVLAWASHKMSKTLSQDGFYSGPDRNQIPPKCKRTKLPPHQPVRYLSMMINNYYNLIHTA